MKQLLFPLGIAAAAACGKVASGDPADAASQDTPAPEAGRFLWQQNLFGTFPSVTLHDTEPYASGIRFAEITLATDRLVPAGGNDIVVAHFDPDGKLQSAWRHGGTATEDPLDL